MTDNCNENRDRWIELEVCNSRLVRTDSNNLTADSVKVYNVILDYMGQYVWTQFMHKYAIFQSETGENYCVDLEYETVESQFLIPAKVLTGDFFKISIMGIYEGSGARRVTNPVTVPLVRSGFTENLQAYDPDLDNGDIFSQLRELINNCLCDVRVEGNQLLFIKEDTVYYRFTITNHQHTSSQITDLEDTIGLEIKRGYQILTNKIRTYGE